jgi:threonine synthase
MFYYFEGYKQLLKNGIDGREVVFTVPSGNFGNLTAGLIAKKMGLPIDRFIAAVNNNDVFHQYCETGKYEPRPSVQTISNAMDVGAPSNFARMMDLYKHDLAVLKSEINTGTVSDDTVKAEVTKVFKENNYVLDPHTAVGLDIMNAYQKENTNSVGVVLSTAHPAKFIDTVEECIGEKIDLPKDLSVLVDRKKSFKEMPIGFNDFKTFLKAF